MSSSIQPTDNNRGQGPIYQPSIQQIRRALPQEDRLVAPPDDCCCDCTGFIDFAKNTLSVIFAIVTFPFRIVWHGLSLLFNFDNECCAAHTENPVQYDPNTGRVLNNEIPAVDRQGSRRNPTPLQPDIARTEGSAALDLPADIIQILINLNRDPRQFRVKLTELGLQNDLDIFKTIRQDDYGEFVMNILPEEISASAPNSVLAKFNPEYFELSPAHFRVVEGAEIPTADTRIQIAQFKDFLRELNERGMLTNLRDDGFSIDARTFIDRFNARIDEFAGGNTINGYGMSAEYISKARNAMRHLIAYFLRQKDAFQSLPSGTEKYRKAETLYYKQLNRVVRELGGGFFHCVNRISTLMQDFYYDLIGNDADLMSKLSVDNKALRILMNFRKTVFDQAIINNMQGRGDSASTLNYYTGQFAARYGVPNDLSRSDQNHNGIAIQGLDAHVRAAFGDTLRGGTQYNVETLVETLRSRFQNPRDTLLPAAEFTQWYRTNLPAGVNDHDILNDDYVNYRSELIVYFLWRSGVVQPRADCRGLTGDAPPPADPARAHVRLDSLVNLE